MHFIIQYSICAAIIYAVVFVYNYRIKNMSIFKNNMFLFFTVIGMLANALDLLRCTISLTAFSCSQNFVYVINCLFYTILAYIPVTYLIYCFSLVDFFHKTNMWKSTAFHLSVIIVYLIEFLYIWISPLFHNKVFSVFYVISNTSLIQNGKAGYLFLYFMSAYYILFGIVVIGKYRKNLSNADLIHLGIILSLMIGTMIVQPFFPYCRFIFFAMSMGTLDCSFYIQRPEDIYDSKIGAFNSSGFKMMIEHLFVIRKKFYLIALVMDDADFYRVALGKKEQRNLDLCILNGLKQEFRKNSSIYKLAFGQYAIIVMEDKNNPIENSINYIKSQNDMRWGFSSMELDLSFRICIMESQNDINSYSEASDVIDLFSTNKKFKGQIVSANTLDLAKMHSKSYLEKSIYDGLSENRFEVYYQPIYSTQEKKLTRAEALVRLRDSDGNFVSPEDFIPISEQNGTIFEIGKMVYTTVCKNLSEINMNEYNLKKVDINLSVIQCIQEDMHKQLITIRNQYNIPAHYINLEITETASSNSPSVLLKNMRHLENDGIELSLDDYGSGNSNVSYLLNLPFKLIKIDKGIVWKAIENERSKQVLKSIIDMIHGLGMTALAEGIETEEQAQILIDFGCEYLQGYYYSRPVDFAKFLEIMKK